MANPHHAISKAIDYFTTAVSKYTVDGPKTSFNVGRMGGDTSVNAIPFGSWIEVDMRSVSPSRLKEIENIFITQMKPAVKDYNATGVKGEITLELKKIGERPSSELSSELSLLQKSMAATVAVGPLQS